MDKAPGRLRAATIPLHAPPDISLGVLLAGPNRQITYTNEGFMRLTGYAESELLGKSCSLLQGPETDPATVEKLNAALRGDGYFDGEILNYRKDGTIFWNALLISPLCDQDGTRTGFIGILRDISERKRRERDSEGYRKFFLISGEPMCIADPFGCFKHVNPAFTRLTGFSEAELVARPFLDFVLPEDRQRTADEMKLQVETRPSLHFENRYLCKNGAVILLSWTATFDKNEGVTYATARDITKLRRAELDLRESEERLRTLAEASFEGIAITEGGVLLDCNEQLARMLGRPHIELLGKSVLEFVAPEHRSMVEEIQRLGRLNPYEHLILRADGTLCSVVVRVRLAHIGGRQVRIAAIRDITERKRIEESLRASEKRFRKIFDANPHPMWVHDFKTLRFLEVNDAAIKHYGYSREEFLAMTTKDIRPPEEVPLLLDKVEAVAAGKNEVGVWHHRKRDGTLIEVKVSANMIEFDGHPAAVVMAEDITATRHQEEGRPWCLGRGDQRNSLAGAEIAAGRENRRTPE